MQLLDSIPICLSYREELVCCLTLSSENLGGLFRDLIIISVVLDTHVCILQSAL